MDRMRSQRSLYLPCALSMDGGCMQPDYAIMEAIYEQSKQYSHRG